MPGHNVVVVGASAGGVETVIRLVAELPADFPAAVFMTIHITQHGPSLLPGILTRAGSMPAGHPNHGEPIRQSRIYVAPPGKHLLFRDHRISLSSGPTENGHRPAVDAMFRSAAVTFGPQVVGVVLSGTLDDGTAGLLAIKKRGGVTVVQDPEEATFAGMPQSAIDHNAADYVVRLDQMAGVLFKLVTEHAVNSSTVAVPREMKIEDDMAEFDLGKMEQKDHPGHPSGFACPDCGGALWELSDTDLVRYRCRVGHAWSAESLLDEQARAQEKALWTALRALEERAGLTERLADRLRARGFKVSAKQIDQKAREARKHAGVLRELLVSLSREVAEDLVSGATNQDDDGGSLPAGP